MSAHDDLPPSNPVAAATHDDPTGYYATLAERGLFFDSALRCWVAPSANSVAEVLSHPNLLVRPPTELVPTALLNTEAAKIFAALVRMTDGPGHQPLKAAVKAALDSISEAEVDQSARELAPTIPLSVPPTGSDITRFNYAFPCVVLAHWIGIPKEDHIELADEVLAFVRCIAPGGSNSEIRAGIEAAGRLEKRVRNQLKAPGILLQRLATEFDQTGLPDTEVLLISNVLGLWFQACEGCAGLIGQALMLKYLRETQSNAEELLDAILDATPPIQNTRRFAAAEANISGCPIHCGDVLLAILPAQDEASQKNFAFGHGPHACPGSRWARSISTAGIDYLLKSGVNKTILRQHRWRRSLNARVPEFVF
jgi:cytochrome P450